MAVGPITFLEIQAFSRLTLVDLTAWEVGLIRRLDEAVLTVISEKATKRTGTKDKPETAIPVENVQGIRALFQGLAARKEAEAKANAPPAPRQRRIINPDPVPETAVTPSRTARAFRTRTQTDPST